MTNSEKKFVNSYNPATGELLGKYEVHTIEEVRGIISKAKEEQIQWCDVPLKKRVQFLYKVREFLVDNIDNIAQAISKDNGKTINDAMATEVLPSIISISYYCKNAKKFLKTKKLSAGNILLINKRSRINKLPYGVIGIISPWNYPFSIPFSEVVMALLAGNTVVLKVASNTQMVGEKLKECFAFAKLPDYVFNYVNLPGRDAGNAMLESGVDKLFFTGSVPVGKKLMAKAADTLTPVVLELGGNDAMLVCEDADIYRAVSGAVWAGFCNAGQSCGGVERIYVHEKVYGEFLDLLKSKIESLQVEADDFYNMDLGVITTERQLAAISDHVESALKQGAVIFAQSKIVENDKLHNYYPATVLTNVDHSMKVMQEETFGPVLAVMKVKNMDESIAYANDSALGLTGSVWSRNRKKARNIAKRIYAGVVTINDHLMSHGLSETPWGGFKESGIGRTHGEIGFDEMVQNQVMIDDILPFVKKNMWWHPHSVNVYNGLKGVINTLYARSMKSRISGLYRMLKIFPRYFTKN